MPAVRTDHVDSPTPETSAQHGGTDRIARLLRSPWMLVVWFPLAHSLIWGLIYVLVAMNPDPFAGMAFALLELTDFAVAEYTRGRVDSSLMLLWLGGVQWAAIGVVFALMLLGYRSLRKTRP